MELEEQFKKTLRHAVHQIAAILRTDTVCSAHLDAGTINIKGMLSKGFFSLNWSNAIEGIGSLVLSGGFIMLVELSVKYHTESEATTILIAVVGANPDELRFTFWDGDEEALTTKIVGCLHSPTLLIESNEIHLLPLGNVLQYFVINNLESVFTEEDD